MEIQKKFIKYFNRTIDIIENIFFIFVFLIGMYFIYDTAYIFYFNSADRVSGFKPEIINAETLLELSDECIGWISIDNTKLDFPIMQSDDNIKYLNTGPDGKYALAGSIFLDSRNSADFSDRYSLIYGHHMTGDRQFGVIDRWLKQEYFNDHLDGTLTTLNGDYKFKIFAIIETTTDVEEIFDPIDHYPMEYIKNNAIYYNEPEEGNLILLSTCKSPTSNIRYALCGIKVED